MSALDFLYPVTRAFDFAALAACIVGPILAVKIIDRSGWQLARARVAYLGYFCCALLASSFALHLAVDGGDIFMVFIFWAAPFGIAASVAMLLTLSVGSSRGLWLLAIATTMLGLAQLVAESSPGGIGGVVAVLLLAAYVAYPIVVLVVSIRQRSEWWARSDDGV